MSVTIKAAWISAAAIIVAAIIAGLFTLDSNEQPTNEAQAKESLNIPIPSGSKVTILIQKKDKQDKLEYEAKIIKKIQEESSLQIIEPSKIKDIIDKQELQSSGSLANNEELKKAVEYVVLYDADNKVVSVFNTSTGVYEFVKPYSLKID